MQARRYKKIVIERGKDYYTYYAMVVNGEEKLYVKNLQEAEAILQELKDKNSANKDNITIEMIFSDKYLVKKGES